MEQDATVLDAIKAESADIVGFTLLPFAIVCVQLNFSPKNGYRVMPKMAKSHMGLIVWRVGYDAGITTIRYICGSGLPHILVKLTQYRCF